jgi:hypothetical protein
MKKSNATSPANLLDRAAWVALTLGTGDSKENLQYPIEAANVLIENPEIAKEILDCLIKGLSPHKE